MSQTNYIKGFRENSFVNMARYETKAPPYGQFLNKKKEPVT